MHCKTLTTPSLLALSLVLSSSFLAGCGSDLSGRYTDHNGMMSVEFKSGKAYVAGPMGGSMQVDYEDDSDSVILKTMQGNLVLNKNKDGSLEGPMGKMSRES